MPFIFILYVWDHEVMPSRSNRQITGFGNPAALANGTWYVRSFR